MARGGYQRPTSPAPVSGPGALAQRTDGGPGSKQASRYISGLPYGEGQQMMATQASAPMEAAAPSPSTPSPLTIANAGTNSSPQPPVQPAPITPLGAPTQRPHEPVTSGSNLGMGPDMASLGLPSPAIAQQQNAAGVVRALASANNSSPALQQLAARLGGGA